jgi:hypothetical protein
MSFFEAFVLAAVADGVAVAGLWLLSFRSRWSVKGAS